MTDRISPPNADIHMEMARLRDGLDDIRGYVKARMARLRPELDPVKPRTVQCPTCNQFALIVGDEENARCLYCHYRRDPDVAAVSYAEDVLGHDWTSVARGGREEPVEWCPNCDMEALVLEAVTAADPKSSVALCFFCGENFSELEECTRCGEPFQPTENELACATCMYDAINDGS
ncbi:hypothetical protein [Kitasatospora sp. NPDC017646]|uniref:hypothetical protein n=1 Tax=Kitasatospora sp. NPDC017646 TaxID=3364024 RepID=UPI0037B93434